MAEAADPDEESLLARRVRAGDAAAFSTLYRRHQAAIFRYGLHMCGRRDLAEEATQETFMAFLRGSERYDSRRGRLAAFLFGIARRQVYRLLRRERPYVELSSAPAAEGEREAGGEAPSVAALRRAISALPPHYREIVVLCELEEMSYEQVAAAVRCSLGTVRSRLHRARALLERKLRAAAHPQECRP